jgi:uroporphyrinogen III methyltransferase / synthase
MIAQPFQGCSVIDPIPRVGRKKRGQPWALGRCPFGAIVLRQPPCWGFNCAKQSVSRACGALHIQNYMTDVTLLPKPLRNRTILVACSAKKMLELVAGIEAMGGNAVSFPVIETQGIDDKRLLDKALNSLQEYAWVIFTSAYGVSYFIQRMKELGITPSAQQMPKICTIGPATARALQDFGYEPTLIPERFVAEGVVEALEEYCGGLPALAGKRILIPRAKEAREVLPEALAAVGAFVEVAPCYQTVRPEADGDILNRLKKRRPDLAVFTSSSAIKNFVDILGPEVGIRTLLESTIAVIGPITSGTAESFGKRPEIIPKENTIASLLEAIRLYYSNR